MGGRDGWLAASRPRHHVSTALFTCCFLYLATGAGERGLGSWAPACTARLCLPLCPLYSCLAAARARRCTSEPSRSGPRASRAATSAWVCLTRRSATPTRTCATSTSAPIGPRTHRRTTASATDPSSRASLRGLTPRAPGLPRTRGCGRSRSSRTTSRATPRGSWTHSTTPSTR